MDNKIGVINIFRVICSGLFDTEFTKILTEQLNTYSDKKYKPITDIIAIFKDMAKDIIDEHHLNYLHKLKNEYRTDVSFLFQDYKMHTIVNGESKRIIVDTDGAQSVNWLGVDPYKEYDDRHSVYQLIGEITRFLHYFQTDIGFIADNYLALKRERKQGDYNITLESAIRTALAEFGVYGTMQNYLTYNIMLSKKGRHADYRINDALDSSVYEKGFKYYHILDNDNYDTQSRINYVAFHDSPEKFLIRLIERTKVVGVSASAKLPTVLANYDLDYIRKVRGELIYELSEQDELRLRNEFEKSIIHHKNTRIYCAPVGFEDNLSTAAKEVYHEIKKISNFEDYKQERFLCYAEVVDKFFQEKTIKSLLYFANAKGREYDIDGQNYLKGYFENLKSAYSSYAEIYFLNGNNDVFERRKEKALQSLKEGKKVLIVTTYGSMGAGQNIHYAFDVELEDDLVRTNEMSHNSMRKDFDAIYLEKPSHVIVNTVNGFGSEEDFIKYIFQVKFLQEVGDLKAFDAEMRIREAFKIFSGNGGRKSAHPKDSAHFNMAYAKIALQAIGRICRTGNKRSKIHIFYQESFAEKIKPILPYFRDKSLNPEFKAFLCACSKYEAELPVLSSEQVLKNRAENVIVQSQQLFDNIVGNWTLNNIAYWEDVREAVLKRPTADHLQDVKFPELYIELPQRSNHYYVNKSAKPMSIGFHNGGYAWERVDEKYVMLDRVLLIPGIKQFFEENGYASEATYTEPVKYYKSCVCGAKGTETFNNGSTLSAQDNQIKLKSGVTLGKTYDGAAYSLSADKFTVNGAGAITFEYKSEGASDWSQTAPVNAGDYKVRVSVAATAEWKAAQATFDFAIAKKQLTISGTTVAGKVYDGTAEATVTAGTLAGLIGGDEVSVGVTATGVFASKDVAYDCDVEPQDVTVSYTLTGDLAKNYLAPVGETLRATINPKPLSNVNLTKVYDGDSRFEKTLLTTAQGILEGESIKIYVHAIGANVGVYKDGDFDFNDYILYIGDSEEETVNYAWGDTCTATITKKQLTVTVSSVIKYYDGTTDFSQSVKAANVEGIVGSDDITVNMTGTLANKNVTNAMQPCNVTFSLSGANKDNYTLKNATQDINVLVSKYNFNLDSKTGYASGKIYVTAKYVNNSGTVTFENVVVTGDIFEGDTITATIVKNGDSSKMGCTVYKTNVTNISDTYYTITFGGADVGNYNFGGETRYNPSVYLTIYEQEVTLDTEFTYNNIYSGLQRWIKVDLQKQEGDGYAIVAKYGTTIDTAKTKMYDMAGNEVADMKPTADGTYFICVTATSDSAIGMTITSPAV